MSDTGHTTALFATPFAVVNTGADRPFNERLASLCHSRSPGGDDLFSATDATLVELRRLMLGQASAVVAGLNTIDSAEFSRLLIQAQGWCSIVQRNGHVASQHFPNASWLAVYCVQAGESDAGSTHAGVLRLYERRLASMYRDASTRELTAPYRYGNHTWSPLPGWMALFPAHVPHEVSVVRSDTALILVFAKIRFLEAAAGGKG